MYYFKAEMVDIKSSSYSLKMCIGWYGLHVFQGFGEIFFFLCWSLFSLS
jgi:hypothetical protein